MLLPVFLILVFGLIEFGKAINYWMDLTHLANEGARYASVNRWPGCGSSPTPETAPCTPATLPLYVAANANTGELRSGGTPYVDLPLKVEICYPETAMVTGKAVRVVVSTNYALPLVDGMLGAIGLGGLAKFNMAVQSTQRLERTPTRIDQTTEGMVRNVSVELLARLRREETGALFVWFAVMLLALLLVGAFVIDVGNWQEHRRHLQVQVDDGALAAGPKFTGCYLDPTETNNRIKAEAHRYSGNSAFPTLWGSMFPTEPTPPGPYNGQVDDPTRVQFRQNAIAYPPGGTDYVMDYRSPTDDVNGPFHPDGIPESAEPCAARMIDVKARDIGIPSFFGGLLPSGLNPTDVRAKARVEIRDVVAMNGFLPWAVPEFAPKSMHAVFVNEASPLGAGQTPIAVLPLTRSAERTATRVAERRACDPVEQHQRHTSERRPEDRRDHHAQPAPQPEHDRDARTDLRAGTDELCLGRHSDIWRRLHPWLVGRDARQPRCANSS